MHQQIRSLTPLVALHVLVLYLPLVISDQCSEGPLIFNFGDSNSDTGGYAAVYGLEIVYPYGRTFFNRSTGRIADGRLIIDFLCEDVKTTYLTPYLDSLDPNFTNGVNFAINGAPILPKYIPFSLGIQLQQFKRFKKRYLDLQSIEDLDNALFTFDIGQNDLSHAFGLFSLREVIEQIPSFISELRDAMSDIYLLGGRNFWVHNTGPLGCLPRENAIRNNVNAADRDQYGCLKSLNEGAKAFNDKLNALCEELRTQMKNSTIVYVDVYSIKYDLIAESEKYGFESPLMACCGYGGGPYNFDPSMICLGGGCTACKENTPYISWDGVHYTEGANVIVASKILSTQYSTPPLDFNFFCNNPRTLAPMLLLPPKYSLPNIQHLRLISTSSVTILGL